MNIDLAALPDDVDALQRMISELATTRDSERAAAQAEIDRLRQIVKTLQRRQFGRRSERLDGDQLQLGLEDLDADIAWAEAGVPARITHPPPQIRLPGLRDDPPGAGARAADRQGARQRRVAGPGAGQ